MRIDVYIHNEPDERFGEILDKLDRIEQKETKMALTMDDVITKVAAIRSVNDSVVSLLQELKAKLDAAIASGDPTKIQEVVDSLGAEVTRLGDAVVANTPAAP